MDVERGKLAEANFREKKYNCAQAVVCAFTDVTGLDEETSIKISAPFGGGMGRLREVCGAMSGALMVLGYARASIDPTDKTEKARLYSEVQEYARRFKERAGQCKTDRGESICASYNCRELLGSMADSSAIPADRTKAYYDARPCPHLVRIAAEVLEEMLFSETVE